MCHITSNHSQVMKSRLHKLNKNLFSNYPKIIILHIILALITLPGIVLCMGVDGHLALENSSNNSECDNLSQAPIYEGSQLSSMALIYSDKGHCGPCTDIAISIDSSDKSTLKAQDFSSEIKGKVFSPFLNVFPVSVEISTEDHLLQKLPTVVSKITSLQTVILLC